MSGNIPDPNAALTATIRDLQARVNRLERGPNGPNSLGLSNILPAKKAGTPSDADYTSATLPPIGSIVYDTTGSKIWVRQAIGIWRGVVVA